MPITAPGAPPLPSAEAMARVVASLVAVLFPRHFPAGDGAMLAGDGARARALDASLVLLESQVCRERAMTSPGAGVDNRALRSRARDIAGAFADGLPAIRAMLESDIAAAYDGDPSAKSRDEVILCFPGIAAITRHRLAHLLYRLDAPVLARIVAETAHSRTGIDIHPGATIGEAFFIDHGTGVVIGETARIGRNVRLYQAVTLGAKRFETDDSGALVKGRPRHPIVEDDVVVYAGATILGRITIGQGSTIGGNVWLTHSVPPGSNITQAKLRASDTFDLGGGI
jgi:serine O-acetyltransferase